MDKIDDRTVIMYLTKEDIVLNEISNRLRAAYGDSTPSYTIVKDWVKLLVRQRNLKR